MTAGLSQKAKKNNTGIKNRIMDPVTRSATQCAAKEGHHASHLASPTPEEGQGSVINGELAGTLDIEHEESVASPMRPQPARARAHDAPVRYFILC